MLIKLYMTITLFIFKFFRASQDILTLYSCNVLYHCLNPFIKPAQIYTLDESLKWWEIWKGLTPVVTCLVFVFGGNQLITVYSDPRCYNRQSKGDESENDGRLAQDAKPFWRKRLYRGWNKINKCQYYCITVFKVKKRPEKLK